MNRKAKLGTKVLTDSRVSGWLWCELLACEWDAADFRLSGDEMRYIPDLAVNVAVTGRKVRYDAPGLGNTPVVRVAVTFVGDDEPDVVVRGWALADTLETVPMARSDAPWAL